MGNRVMVVLLLLGAACAPIPPLPPSDPDYGPRGPGDGLGCPATCSRLRALGCVEGEPSPEKGVPCESFCHETDVVEAWDHACIQAAETCDAARACEER